MLSKKYTLCLFFIIGFLHSGNIYSKGEFSSEKGLHPRSEVNTGTGTSLNGKSVVVSFDFSFGIVNTQIKTETGQVVYSSRTNTDNVNYSLIDITSLTKGSYIITYTDSKGNVIDILDLTIN